MDQTSAVDMEFLATIIRNRVKSGIFGQTAKFGKRLCLFHISNIRIKNRLTKQRVKIMCVRIYLMSEFTRLYPRSELSKVGQRVNSINMPVFG